MPKNKIEARKELRELEEIYAELREEVSSKIDDKEFEEAVNMLSEMQNINTRMKAMKEEHGLESTSAVMKGGKKVGKLMSDFLAGINEGIKNSKD